MAAAQLAELRALLEQKFPDAMPLARRTSRPASTGIAELDRALPNGGFPLGKLSACEPQGGSTSILRAACQACITAGDRAAWIDGSLTITGAFWDDGPLLVRPRGDKQAIGAADLLLRSGGFRIVVLAGVDLESADSLRLVRAAHEGGGALVVVATKANVAALRLSVRIAPESYRWHHDPFGDPAEAHDVRLHAEVRALGWNARAEFTLPVQSHELRLSLESGLADRRGRTIRPGQSKTGNSRSRRRVVSAASKSLPAKPPSSP
ncbi:hypothetical protein LBMAG44_05340 [Gemmatimonadota bacterium]|jgi:hypothetical protein|nr:hypothetical protein LBMAG44_05340 [Gemmatimonadota bacterium]